MKDLDRLLNQLVEYNSERALSELEKEIARKLFMEWLETLPIKSIVEAIPPEKLKKLRDDFKTDAD